jgi:hypothetical protein
MAGSSGTIASSAAGNASRTRATSSSLRTRFADTTTRRRAGYASTPRGTPRTVHPRRPTPAAAPSRCRRSNSVTRSPRLPSRPADPTPTDVSRPPSGAAGRCYATTRSPRPPGSEPGPCPFLEARAYAFAYLLVTSARDTIGQLTPHAPPRSPFRGHSYVRHGQRFAGSFRESRRTVARNRYWCIQSADELRREQRACALASPVRSSRSLT